MQTGEAVSLWFKGTFATICSKRYNENNEDFDSFLSKIWSNDILDILRDTLNDTFYCSLFGYYRRDIGKDIALGNSTGNQKEPKIDLIKYGIYKYYIVAGEKKYSLKENGQQQEIGNIKVKIRFDCTYDKKNKKVVVNNVVITWKITSKILNTSLLNCNAPYRLGDMIILLKSQYIKHSPKKFLIKFLLIEISKLNPILFNTNKHYYKEWEKLIQNLIKLLRKLYEATGSIMENYSTKDLPQVLNKYLKVANLHLDKSEKKLPYSIVINALLVIYRIWQIKLFYENIIRPPGSTEDTEELKFGYLFLCYCEIIKDLVNFVEIYKDFLNKYRHLLYAVLSDEAIFVAIVTNNITEATVIAIYGRYTRHAHARLNSTRFLGRFKTCFTRPSQSKLGEAAKWAICRYNQKKGNKRLNEFCIKYCDQKTYKHKGLPHLILNRQRSNKRFDELWTNNGAPPLTSSNPISVSRKETKETRGGGDIEVIENPSPNPKVKEKSSRLLLDSLRNIPKGGHITRIVVCPLDEKVLVISYCLKKHEQDIKDAISELNMNFRTKEFINCYNSTRSVWSEFLNDYIFRKYIAQEIKRMDSGPLNIKTSKIKAIPVNNRTIYLLVAKEDTYANDTILNIYRNTKQALLGSFKHQKRGNKWHKISYEPKQQMSADPISADLISAEKKIIYQNYTRIIDKKKKHAWFRKDLHKQTIELAS